MKIKASKNGCVFLASLCIILSCSIASATSLEKNLDRPGSDYKNFDLTMPDPHLCELACDRDPDCQAFSYNPPGMSGPNAKCWLKNIVPSAANATGVVSGVKGLDRNLDRPGSDYKNFDLTCPDPYLCALACDGDPNCRAFSYNPAGMSGPNAMCWLKNEIPPIRNATGVVSGIKDASIDEGDQGPQLNKLIDSATLKRVKSARSKDNKDDQTPVKAVMKWYFYSDAFCPEVVDPRVNGYAEIPSTIVFMDDGTWGDLSQMSDDRPSNIRGKWGRNGEDFWLHDDIKRRDYYASWSEEEMSGRWSGEGKDGCWSLTRIS
jgi:hypothetical protein